MKTQQDIINELQAAIVALQATLADLQVFTSDPIVEVDTLTQSGTKVTFVPKQ